MRPKHFDPSVKDSAPSSSWFIIKVKVRQENPHVPESFMTNSDTNILFMLMKVYLGSCHASSPTSIFKGHKIPFTAALCQVTWIFQLKSISVLSALCVSVLTDTPPRSPGGILSDAAPAFCLCDVLWMLRAIAGAVFQAQMMKSIELFGFFFFTCQMLKALHAVALLKRSLPFEPSENVNDSQWRGMIL